MRLYIQEKENLIKFNLPAKIDGSLLYSYKSYSTGLENSINIDSQDDTWILKSNGSVDIINNNSGSIGLTDYMCVPIHVIGHGGYTCLFCLPSVENNSNKYDLSNTSQITIGSGDGNNIVYKQNMMKAQHAIIQMSEGNWYITPATNEENCYLYVNNKRILNTTRISIGDVIFMNGLRLIWMQKFFKIPMSSGLFRINGIPLMQSLSVSNSECSEVNEVDSNVTLYRDDEYFSHVPRIRSVVEDKEINIDSPPGKQTKDSDMPFLLTIGSSITMFSMMSVQFINIYNSIQAKRPFLQMLPTIVMCVSMFIGTLIMPRLVRRWTKKQERKREELRQKKYGDYLLKKQQEIEITMKKQAQILIENNSGVDICKSIVETKNRSLWSREVKDDDFIDVKLGTGTKPANIVINAPEERFTLDDDSLFQTVCQIKDKYRMLENVPITISLKEQIAIALILTCQFKDYYVDAIMLQLITYHSPLDLKLVIFSDKANEEKWDYIRYLPHCWSDDKTTRYFATTQEEMKVLCQKLEEEYSLRKEKKSEKLKEDADVSKEKAKEYAIYDAYYLIITDNFKMIKSFKFIEDLLGSEYNYGFSMLVIDKNMKNLPKQCQKFICVNDNDGGIFSGEIKEEEMIKFKAEYDPSLNMRHICKLISNVPVQGKDAEHELPSMLPFLEMFNAGKIEQLNVRNRWATSDPITTLQTPIGVHKNGELFKLDLHEKFDGPHGLIAGSTGSGKSEFIISYILSMALNYDPKEVQFVLIDYKGGGLAGAFENREQGISIPHLAGTITNLDVAEMNRTLVSIESELKRRQRKFNEEREKTGESTMDIYKYQRLYREGLIDEPISHLFIISDEFAELKAQQPEFMAQLISTARIGRSLGVHLVLATQKPSGVVNDQIWSNSKFKVCLKVQSRSDSMEMLKRPEAASIKETGRFYLQVGYDEYFDIGQSAWSGVKYQPVERIVKKIDDSIVFVDSCGNVIKKINDIVKQEKQDEDFGDQLTNVVKYLKEIAENDGIKSKTLWLPALSKNILFDELLKKYKYQTGELDLKPVIGEYDAPAIQQQGLLTLDLLKDGNVLIYGSPGTGKENIIITMVYSLAMYHSPKEVNFYIGDFGAETLKMLKKFPHVGDVFITEEEAKLDSLVKMLDKELERRKKEYSDFGGNYLEYCKLTKKIDPVIVVALNNFENFTETYSRKQDVFSTLFRDGQKYGIVFVVTTTVSSVVRNRVAQLFLNKICLKMPNATDYRDLLGSPRGLVPVDTYGRGIVAVDGAFAYEFQTANIIEKENRTQFLKDTASKLKEKYPNLRAKKIPVLPEVAYVEDLLFELKGLDCLPIGVEKNTLEVYVYDFLENKVNLIAGKNISNHIYFIYALIKQMLMLDKVKVHIIDALSLYRGNYEGVNYYKDDLDKAFITAYNNVSKDSELDCVNVYICIGVLELKNKISSKYEKHFENLFKAVNNCKNNTFLFVDSSDNYKELGLYDWYRDNINNTYGIWLGEDIASQVTLGVMSLTIEDKQTLFPCIGYPVYQGYHMIVKYAVDGVDRPNEE